MIRPAIAGLAVFVTLLPFAARAADSTDPAALVKELGSDSFPAREEATRQLFHRGRAAIPALTSGVKSTDPEVRRRCAMLLPLAQRTDEELWLDDFINGKTEVQKPLVGWAALQKLVGDGLESRMLFADLYRGDRAVLELLEKDASKVGSQAMERTRSLQQRFSMRGPGAPSEEPSAAEVSAALLAASIAANADQQMFYQLTNLFYQPAIRSAIQRTPGASKLVGRVLSQRGGDINQMSQSVYIARSLGLQDYIDEKLKPAVRKEAETVPPGDPQGRFSQLVYLARNLDMEDLINEKLKPGVHKMAEDAAKQPTEAYKFQQAVSMAQTLKMQDTLDNVLKPAGLKFIQLAAEHPEDMGRFYQVQYVARALGLNEAVDSILRPAACKYVAALVAQPGDVNKFYQAQNIARMLQLSEAVEGVLQPAARKIVLASLEQSAGDVNRMNQAMSLARTMDLGDLVEDTLKPWVRRQAAALDGQASDMTRITQLHNAAQTLGLRDVIDNDIKPVFRKVVLALVEPAGPAGGLDRPGKDQPINQNTANQVFNLARGMGVKEAAPYALKVSLARDMNAYTRGMAMFFLADAGSKEEVARLEALLDDAAGVGSSGINWTTINAEIRDVALGVLVYHSGQSLSDYGFPYYQMVAGARLTTSWPGSLGFADAKGREAAHKKWKEWSATQKK